MPITIARLCRYPVKSLSIQEVPAVMLEAGGVLPEDRRFALMLTSGGTAGPGRPPTSNLVTLARFEKLAALQTDYDPATATLTVCRNGRQVAHGALTSTTGRVVIEHFFAAYLSSDGPRFPKVVEASGGAFTDQAEQLVAVLNLASVRDLERVVQKPVDPRRFRANLWLDGVPAWAESHWVGRTLAFGPLRLEVIRPIERCAVTNLNPVTGVRDMNIPRALEKGFGHTLCGVLARVTAGGPLASGDTGGVI